MTDTTDRTITMSTGTMSPGTARKFTEAGDARCFRGNTFICHIDKDSAFFATQEKIMRDFEQTRFAEDFALLPLNSMHMTIFEGVIEDHRGTTLWPGDLPHDMAIEDVTFALAQQVRQTHFREHRGLTLTVNGLKTLRSSFTINLSPADAETETRLKSLRSQISAVTGITHADPDSYRFHSSMGYRIRPAQDRDEDELLQLQSRYEQWLAEAAPTLTLGPCEFNIHQDMLAFPVLHFLG